MSGISEFVVDRPEDSIAVSMTKRIWQKGSMGKPTKVAKFSCKHLKLLLLIKINAIYQVTLGGAARQPKFPKLRIAVHLQGHVSF
jgi:hypothetical protein